MEKLLRKAITNSRCGWLVGLLVATLVASVSAAPNSNGKLENKSPNALSATAKPADPAQRVKASLGSRPLTFEVNKGQADPQVKYIGRAAHYTIMMMPDGTTLRINAQATVQVKLQNANTSPKVQGEDLRGSYSNYYIGNDPSKWIEHVAQFGKVRYQDVYPGIDVVYHADQRDVEYDFVVKPGIDPSQIHMAYEGVQNLSINANGDLEIKSAAGVSVNRKPVVYQVINGQRKNIEGEFTLADNKVGFKLGKYDRSQTLVIDPTLQVLAFFGGTLNDEAAAIAVSATQAATPGSSTPGVFFCGRSESPALPGSTGKTTGINWDAFVTGLNAGVSGTPDAGGINILWTTFIGGTGDDACRGIAADNQGIVYIAGYTNSLNFPTVNPAQQYDAFVGTLSSAGSGFKGALYGGPGVDEATSIALDYSTFAGTSPNAINPTTDPTVTPNIVVGGFTSSGLGGPSAGSLPKPPQPGFQPTFRTCENNGFPTSGGNCGNIDGFVAIFNKALTLLAGTYLGGGGNDQVNGVAVDVGGNVYVTGFATPDVIGCGLQANGQCPSPIVTPGTFPNPDLASFFPVINGLGTDLVYDTSQAGGGAVAVPFVAKFACMAAAPIVGIPSAPPTIPTCNGSNKLNFLEHSALFGGSPNFINPQQLSFNEGFTGQEPISEAGLAIAVDQGGLYPAEVAIIVNRGDNVGLTISDNNIVPAKTFSASSTTGIVGGFQPGIAGPRVYVVGATSNFNFADSLNASSLTCSNPPNVANPPQVKALCPKPPVLGGVSPVGGGYPVPAPGGARARNGQSQGWLASFQFPAVTQVTVTPPGATSNISATTPPCAEDSNPLQINTLYGGGPDTPYLPGIIPGNGQFPPLPFAGPNASTCIATKLQPPTIVNYVVLQPPTCPGYNAGTNNNNSDLNCVQGRTAPANMANAPLRCTVADGITCPTAFIGAWTGVAVDSGQQVYVIGQVGMSNGGPAGVDAAAAGAGVWGVGLANRLALEIERIDPFGNPEFIFPSPTAPVTSSFVIDTTNTLGNIYGQILPGAPPPPDPNQPGGLAAAIAVNTTREAFFVGTTTDLTPTGSSGKTATLPLTITAGVVQIGPTAATAGTGYPLDAKAVKGSPFTVTGVSGCTTNPPLIYAFDNGAGGVSFSLSSTGTPTISTVGTVIGGVACTGTPSIAIPAPTAATPGSNNYLTQSPVLELSVLPTPPTQFSLGGAACLDPSKICAQNAATDSKTGSGPEDVIYGAIQFYDAIATPEVLNFTQTVNLNGIIPAAKLVNFTNWEQQPINVPPGCVVTVNPASLNGYFTATPIFGVSTWAIQPTPNIVRSPGVYTAYIEFDMTGPCSGVTQPPLELTAFDRVLATISVSAPLNLSPQETYVITSKLNSGIVDQYLAQGVQLVANQQVKTNVGVTTAESDGPINFTVQIVPGPNWTGSVTRAITAPVMGSPNQGANDIIYSAPGQGTAPQAQIPITVDTNIIEGLPIGTYTAMLVFTASPATPVTPAAASVLCNPNSSPLATLPPQTGTTTPSCLPISITITSTPQAAQPVTIVFGAGNTTPQQTSLSISNPLGATGPFNFTAGYIPDNFYGSPLPAQNVFFVGTSTPTLISANGGFVTGSIVAGGQFSQPIQINPTIPSPGYPNGLVTGVYSGEILVSNNGQASGATPQTTVPILVYVGPLAGIDTPSNNGLGLMFPPNSPFLVGGIGGCPVSTLQPGQSLPLCPPPGTNTGAGAYPITISVPAGYAPSQLPEQYLIMVTALNNTSANPYIINPPVVSANLASAVTVLNGDDDPASPCKSFANQNSSPLSPLGPACSWVLVIDATNLTSSVSGTLTFNPGVGSTTFAPLVVPFTIQVTDFPTIFVTQPFLFPNPAFGTGIPEPNFCDSAAFPISCPQMLIGVPLPAAGIVLQSQQNVNGQACAEVSLNTNGGGWFPNTGVQNVTIAPFTVPWLTVAPSTAVFNGAIPALSSPLEFSEQDINGWGFAGGLGLEGGTGAVGTVLPVPQFYTSLITAATNNVPKKFWASCNGGVSPCSAINTVAPFPAGPFTVNNALQTFQICANTATLGSATGPFSTTLTINGGGTPINIPVTFNIASNSPITGNSGSVIKELAIARPGVTSTGAACPAAAAAGTCTMVEAEADLTNSFNSSTKFRSLGLNGDTILAGDFFGTGATNLVAFRCPAPGAGQCQWYVDANNNGQWDGQFGSQIGGNGDALWFFGLPGDIPVVGDWTGDGKAKIGVMRCPPASSPGLCTWYLDLGNKHGYDPATVGTYVYGLTGDKPAVGPWAGNGNTADQIGVFRCPAAGTCQWFLESLGLTGISTTVPTSVYSPSDKVFNFGLPGDQPVVANWNGNGVKRIGVFRTSTGQWFVDTNGNGMFDPASDQVFSFGVPNDQAFTGFFTN